MEKQPSRHTLSEGFPDALSVSLRGRDLYHQHSHAHDVSDPVVSLLEQSASISQGFDMFSVNIGTAVVGRTLGPSAGAVSFRSRCISHCPLGGVSEAGRNKSAKPRTAFVEP
jgi:hypothetical protein